MEEREGRGRARRAVRRAQREKVRGSLEGGCARGGGGITHVVVQQPPQPPPPHGQQEPEEEDDDVTKQPWQSEWEWEEEDGVRGWVGGVERTEARSCLASPPRLRA